MAAKSDARKSSQTGFIAVMAGLTLLAGGGGLIVGKLVSARLKTAAQVVAASAQAPAAAPAAASPYNGIEIRELPPIVTNLANPATTGVRLQVALVYAKKPMEDIKLVSAQIGDDLISFVKTLSLDQLQGASGLQNLREDLTERAVIRSQGSVREVIIEAIITQ
jgi:flagellar FliL protein